jgi:hypothetical protein
LEELTGGRINVLNHLTKLLKNHPVFNWSNYGIAWEVDHIIPFKMMKKLNVSDYYRINNWANLRPRLPEKNKRPEQWQDEDDSEDEESQSLDAPGEESQTLNAPAEKESECY